MHLSPLHTVLTLANKGLDDEMDCGLSQIMEGDAADDISSMGSWASQIGDHAHDINGPRTTAKES